MEKKKGEFVKRVKKKRNFRVEAKEKSEIDTKRKIWENRPTENERGRSKKAGRG